MTPVVIDASAGVELVAYTVRGRALRRILPPDAVPWVPESFYVECGAVLRRWALRAALSPAQMTAAIDELMAWPLRVTEVRGLWRDAWHLRANVTFSDALYVALAEHLAHSCSPTTRSWPPRRTCQSERCTSADLIQFQKGFASSIGPHGADRTKGVHVTITMSVVLADDCERVRGIVVGFLAGDCGGTRRSYATDLRIFATWCAEANLDLFAVRRAHLELFGRWMEEEGKMRSTVARRLSSLASFYRYCEQEGLIERNPAANLRRPKVDYESRTLGLDRNELGAFFVQAGLGSPRDHALASLLALNGLRISEALGADIDALEFERGHRTLKVVRKGGKTAVIPLAPRTSRALDLYIGERTTGPIFLGMKGERMDRYAADRMVKRLARRAGITKRISPHSLRHFFITAALDAGVPLRDVQEAASHSDPRTTMRYDRGRGSLDRHATYIVATFLAGASRWPTGVTVRR